MIDADKDDILAQFLVLYAKAAASNAAELRRQQRNKRKGTCLDCTTVLRIRKSVLQVYREMRKSHFRRAFRMSYPVFCRLLRFIEPQSRKEVDVKEEKPGYNEYCPNQPIELAVRLGAAIRFLPAASHTTSP